jgi:anti-sigma regulatory factor (Ser/Thr protein kinase)
MNPKGELLKEERLVQFLRRALGSTAKEAVRLVLDETHRFAGGAEQSDDISLLVLKYLGPGCFAYRLEGGLEEIPALAEAVGKFAADNGVPKDAAFKANLSLEEIITNTVSYGYPAGGERDITVHLSVRGRTLVMEARDNAVPFNPLESSEPDTGQDVEDREIGGLGIHIVRTMMDGITYRREAGYNILTMEKSF